MNLFGTLRGVPSDELSPQQLIDCVEGGSWVSDGCNSGKPHEAFEYAHDHDLCTEEDYPLSEDQGRCTDWWSCSTDNYVAKHTMVEPLSRLELFTAIAQGPTAVGVDASSDSFRFFGGGILASDCEEEINHHLTAVGYGFHRWWIFWTNNYVTFKNNWGADWGEKGFINIGANPEDGRGICGIHQYAVIPHVKEQE